MLGGLRTLAGVAWGVAPFMAVAVVAGAVPIVATQGWLYYQGSQPLGLREIEVEGQRGLAKAEILDLADIRLGADTLGLDAETIEERLVAHPEIKRAEVVVEPPARVRIRVVERGPAAVVAAGGLYLADAGGALYKPVGAADDVQELVVITGMSADELQAPGTRREAQARVRRAIELSRTVGRHTVSRIAPLGEVHWDATFGWRIGVGTPATEVLLGFGDIETKLDRLFHVLVDLEGRNQRAVAVRLDDERDAGRVAVRSVPVRRKPAPEPGAATGGDSENLGELISDDVRESADERQDSSESVR